MQTIIDFLNKLALDIPTPGTLSNAIAVSMAVIFLATAMISFSIWSIVFIFGTLADFEIWKLGIIVVIMVIYSVLVGFLMWLDN